MTQRSPMGVPKFTLPAAHDPLTHFFFHTDPPSGASVSAREDPGDGTANRTTERVAIAEAMLRFRAVRREILNPDYFGEAAFNMLLDLYVCQMRGRTVYQNDAYIASMVPATTAYRWLLTLERDGMVALKGDAQDRRRGIVLLTPVGAARIETLLDAWSSMLPRPGDDPLSS